MQDNTLIILGLCGAALVLMAIGAFVFWWITRSLHRFFIAGLIRRLIGGVDDYTQNDEVLGAQAASRGRRDLRNQAQSLDFDSAVARYRGEPVPPTQPVDASAQSQPTAPPENTSPNTPSLRSRGRRRRSEHDDSVDEYLGGLDTDADLDI